MRERNHPAVGNAVVATMRSGEKLDGVVRSTPRNIKTGALRFVVEVQRGGHKTWLIFEDHQIRRKA